MSDYRTEYPYRYGALESAARHALHRLELGLPEEALIGLRAALARDAEWGRLREVETAARRGQA